MNLRVIILAESNVEAVRYTRPLQERGHHASVCFDEERLIRLSAEHRFNCVVIDALQASERRRLIDRILLRHPYDRPPAFVWLTSMYSTSTPARDFRHAWRGPEGVEIHDVARGDIRDFLDRINFIEMRVAKVKPMVTIKHTRRVQLLETMQAQAHNDWITKVGCDPFESVADVLLPDNVSLLRVGKRLPDPLRPLDLFWFDRLAAHSYFMKWLDYSEFARSMTDESSYVFASLLSMRSPEGFTRDDAKNACKRLRQALDAGGLDGRELIVNDGGFVYLDRQSIDLRLMHVPE